MEDILASIRRILSEEEGGKAEGPPADLDLEPEAGAANAPAQPAAVAGPETPAAPTRPGPLKDAAVGDTPADADIELSDLPPDLDIPAVTDVLQLTPAMRVKPVVSTMTTAAATDVLTQLAKAILDRRDIAVGGRDVTLESMVREMLRPLLKEWLDRNLPYLIERLVKKEIDVMINRAERLED